MTVREAVSVLKTASRISLIWCECAFPLDASNALMMDAYGDYKVEIIRGAVTKAGDVECDHFDIHLAAQPVKENGAV